jgi:uncharacterized protein YciI
MKHLLLVLAMLLMPIIMPSEEKNTLTPQSEEDMMKDMKVYYMVFLTKGPNRDNSDTAAVMKLQREHLANIDRLHQEGYIAMAGPFIDNQDLRGIFIFDCESKEKVDSLVKTDPAIKTGRLDYEIKPWFTKKGVCLP